MSDPLGVLLVAADRYGPVVAELGGWSAPMGIVLVADRMSERIVDSLEAVQVDEEHGHAGVVALRDADRARHAVAQQRAVVDHQRAGRRVDRQHLVGVLGGRRQHLGDGPGVRGATQPGEAGA